MKPSSELDLLDWAAFARLPNAASMLTPIEDTMSVMVTQGDTGTAVPVDFTRRWTAAMKELNTNYKYLETPGEDRFSIIFASTFLHSYYP